MNQEHLNGVFNKKCLSVFVERSIQIDCCVEEGGLTRFRLVFKRRFFQITRLLNTMLKQLPTSAWCQRSAWVFLVSGSETISIIKIVFVQHLLLFFKHWFLEDGAVNWNTLQFSCFVEFIHRRLFVVSRQIPDRCRRKLLFFDTSGSFNLVEMWGG